MRRVLVEQDADRQSTKAAPEARKSLAQRFSAG